MSIATSIAQQLRARVSSRVHAGVALGVVRGAGARRDVLCEGVTAFPAARFQEKGTRPQLPVDEYTQFELGNATHVLSALLVADSVRRGELEYDGKVSDVLSGLGIPQLKDKTQEHLTVEHLATNTSCFPCLLPGQVNRVGGDPFAGFSSEDAIRVVADGTFLSTLAELRFGQAHSYSNLGFELLGLCVTEATGRSLPELFRERIFEPLHMSFASFGSDHPTTTCTRLVQGQERTSTCAVPHNGPVSVPFWHAHSDRMGFSFNARASLHDMMHFAAAALNPFSQDYNLSPSLIQAFHDTRVPRLQAGSTLGWHYLRLRVPSLGGEAASPDDERVISFHNGTTGGSRSFIGLSLEEGSAVVLLSNSNSFADDVALEALGMEGYLGMHPDRVQLTASEALVYRGRYQLDGYEGQQPAVPSLVIDCFGDSDRGDDDVWVRLNAGASDAEKSFLVCEGADRFRMATAGAAIYFQRAPDGQIGGMLYDTMDGNRATYAKVS